jgi:hypothetical protein
MIYGRFGDTVTVERYATIADVKRLDGRKPDKQDRQMIENNAYVIVTSVDDGKERLYAIAFLRADGGLSEIMQALDS